jgi:hypothetical protein
MNKKSKLNVRRRIKNYRESLAALTEWKMSDKKEKENFKV